MSTPSVLKSFVGGTYAPFFGEAWGIPYGVSVPRVLKDSPGGEAVKLVIPMCPPSLNVMMRLNWRKKAKLQNDWRALVRAYRPDPYFHPFVKMRCKITLHHARLYDRDNSYGAAKCVVDGLVAQKLLFDDTAEWVELTVEQAKCAHKKRHTIIELEPA